MKKTGIAFLLMVSLAYGALWTYNIKAPGIGGLVSNIDEGDSNEKIALKSQNTSVDEVAGRIERRLPVRSSRCCEYRCYTSDSAYICFSWIP